MIKRARIFEKRIPMYLLGIVLLAIGSGAAAGTVLTGKITGEIPVAASQALLVGDPISAVCMLSLEDGGAAIAAWSEAQANSGAVSVKLEAPGPAGTGNVASAVKDVCNIELRDVQPLSYYVYASSGYPPYVNIYIDVNGNGKWDGINPDDILTLEPYYWQWVYEQSTFGGVAFAEGIDNLQVNHNPNFPPWSPNGGFRGSPIWAPDTWLQINLHDDTALWSRASQAANWGSPGFGLDDILYEWGDWEAGNVPAVPVDPDGMLDSFSPNPLDVPATAGVLKIEIAVDDWGKASLGYLDDIAVGNLKTINLRTNTRIPQAMERCFVAPDQFVGVHSDDQTSFEIAAEVDIGDMFLIAVPLKNASENNLVAQLTLHFPECLEVEVVTADQLVGEGNTSNAIRTGLNTWKLIVEADAEKLHPRDYPGDSIYIAVSVDDHCAPGFYTICGTIKQISY